MDDKKQKPFDLIIFVLYICFCASLIFSWRAISSISTGLLAFAGIVANLRQSRGRRSPPLKQWLFIICCCYFIDQFVTLLYTTNLHEGWRNIRLKSAIIIISFFLCYSNYLSATIRIKILNWYCVILLAACAFALVHAGQQFSIKHDYSVFVYHPLVSIYSGHAIQFSILVFVALVYLIESAVSKTFLLNKSLHIAAVIFFLFFLILLSSKLILVFFFIYLFYTTGRAFIFSLINRRRAAVMIVGILAISLLLILVNNPVKDRFRDITNTDFAFFQKKQFSPDEYFNGLQFRLLQWRFVPEILSEKHAWLKGVSVGDAQSLLNQKYKDVNMYVGDPRRGDKGFTGYNTHNEFLESLLQSGIPGLLIFSLLIVAMVRMCWQNKNASLSFVTILLAVYSFSESVFESQYSLFIFLFFPLFLCFAKEPQ